MKRETRINREPNQNLKQKRTRHIQQTRITLQHDQNHHRTNRETKRNAKNNQLRETTSRNTTAGANK